MLRDLAYHRDAYGLTGRWAAYSSLIFGLSAIALLAGCNNGTGSQETKPVAVPVKVATPIEREVTPFEEARGMVKAKYLVDLHSQITGYLKEIGFEDGDEVKEGQMLFLIDPVPFQAAYDQAVADEKIKIAHRELTKAELARNRNLLPKGAVSQSDFDKTAAAYEEAKAAVDAAAAVKKTAEQNLKYTKIISKHPGRIGKALISTGNLVVANVTLLSTVAFQDPIEVEFNIDELIFNDLQKKVREGKIPASAGKNIPVYLKLSNDIAFVHQGELNFIDNAFSKSTGTILLRAELANPKLETGSRLFVPEMNVTVRMPIGMPAKFYLVAERAIGSDLDKKFVVVINKEGKPEKRIVKLGTTENGLRAIEEGLGPNDQVIVVGGQNALRPGVTLNKQVARMEDYEQKPAGEAAPSANASAPKGPVKK
jgi:RND family efflux transporter MFP subunit